MSLFEMNQLSIEEIYKILERAKEFEEGILPNQSAALVANLFYEPSTRTKMSFEIAEKKLGMEVLNLDVVNSSVQKGEDLYDTAKTLEVLGVDLLIIRHWENKFYEKLKNIKVPIINAGDGEGNHPTQSLLDLYTIQKEYKKIEGLKITIAGDIKHSRVAKSNIEALKRLGANIAISGPKSWMTDEADYVEIDEAVKQSDILMLLRIQNERHKNNQEKESINYLEEFGLTTEREKRMKDKAIIMHPGPVNRGVEIESRLVESQKSRIFNQMKNGVYVRMAIMESLLIKKG